MSCSVGGCDTPAYSRGWCRSHYERMWRRGSIDYKTEGPGYHSEIPEVVEARSPTAAMDPDFWEKVDRQLEDRLMEIRLRV